MAAEELPTISFHYSQIPDARFSSPPHQTLLRIPALAHRALFQAILAASL
jgi:hypothetical protein